MEKRTGERLAAAGVDLAQGLERFMGKEALYRKFALKFLEDPNFEKLRQALSDGDAGEAFAAAHTLKGVCGNLSFNRLYAAAEAVVEPLREDRLADAREHMEPLCIAYSELWEALKGWADEQ